MAVNMSLVVELGGADEDTRYSINDGGEKFNVSDHGMDGDSGDGFYDNNGDDPLIVIREDSGDGDGSDGFDGDRGDGHGDSGADSDNDGSGSSDGGGGGGGNGGGGGGGGNGSDGNSCGGSSSGEGSSSSVSSGSSDSGGGGRCNRLIRYCVLCFLLFILVVIIFPVLHSTLGSHYNRQYGQTDTDFIPFSRVLCQNLKLRTYYNGSNEYNVSFYMLHSRPGLFTQELFSISEKIVAETEQRYQFYLRSGSQITVSVCFVDGAAIIPLTGLYLVKGTHGYDGTHIMRSDLKSVVAEFAIFYKCNDSAMAFSYTVEDDDFYYLIFQTATLGDSLLHLNVNVSLHSTHYSLYNTTTTSSCSLSTPSNESTCSVSVPLSTRNYALLTIHPEPSDVDKLELETHCEPRLWVYVVPPLLLMCMLICASCCHFCIKENHKCKTFFFCYWIRKSVKGRILILSCSLMIILISAILCLRFTVGSSYSNEGQSYGPTDTRLVPFSNLLCQGLSLQTNFNGTPEYNISFFMLPSQPELFQSENYTISERITAEIVQHYIFYMHSGSEIIVHACFVDSNNILPLTRLYIVKGVHGYNGGYLRSDIKSVVAEFSISVDCTKSRTPFYYSIEMDDFYYLIFHTGVLGIVPVLHLNVNMLFHSTHYSYNDIANSCTLSTSNYGSVCSLGVPFFAKRYALLAIHPISADVDRLDQIPLETHCHPRLWLYILPPLLLLYALYCASCCCFLTSKTMKWKRLNSYCVQRVVHCKSLIFNWFKNRFKYLIIHWFKNCLKSKKCIICYCSPYLLVIILISIILGLRFTIGSFHTNGRQSYGPTDTRLIPFSNSFCQSLTLKTKYSGSDEYKLSFFMLRSQPGLFAHENFTISVRVVAAVEQHYRFYMYSGSEVTVSACFVNSAVIVPLTWLYIVRGDGYNGGYLSSDDKSVVTHHNISYNCMNTVASISYSIRDADFYYFVFYTSNPGVPVLYLDVKMSFYHIHYAVYDDPVISSCTLSTSNYGSMCSVSVPLSTRSYALLTIHPESSDVDRLDEVPLETHCEPRLWVYVVPPFLLISMLVCASCCCYCMKKSPNCKQFICCSTKCRRLTCYGIPYSLLAILIGTVLGLHFSVGSSFSNEGQSYGPTDTRLIPFSNILCQSLSLRTNSNGSREYNISFFMLPSKPQLFELENYTISETIAAKLEQHYLFYMHSGSQIIVSACFVDNATVVPFTSLYIVKGVHGYNGEYLRSDIKSVVAKSDISYDCETSVQTSYYVEDDYDDFYYIIFHTGVLGNIPVLNLNVKMSLYRTRYAVFNDPITSSCTLSTASFGSMCSLNVPLSTKSYALLTIHPESSDVDRLDEVPLETHCEPRLWVYIVPPLLLMCMLICASCCCYCMKKNSSCKQFICCSAKCRRFTCYCIPYSLVIILIGTALGVRFTIGSSYSNEGQRYGPTDTRLIPFSNIFCQSLSLQTNFNDSSEYNISFFMLPSQPQLYEHENFSISEKVVAEVEQHYLFYMHSGSQVIVSACFVDSAAFVPFTSLYIVKGVHGYDGGYLRGDIKSIVAEFAISYNCRNNTFSYYVENGDFYFLIFQASVSGVVPVLRLNVNMSFHLTLYAIQYNNTVASSCSLSSLGYGSKCSVSVPISYKSYALLSIHPLSFNVNWLDEIPLETHCDPRLWVYVLPPFVLTLLLICINGLSCACKCTTTIRSASESEFASIKDQFRRDWTKGIAPNVKAIFVIKNKTSTKMKWCICKVSLVCRLHPGHSEMYYHGTKIFCKIMGDKRLCSGEDCSICGISLNGFKRSKIRRGRNAWQRFGPGFYLAPNSSKANDYAQKQGTRAMLLCDVRPGEKKRMKHDNPQHTQFAGYQSIYGDIGGHLNYPEIVIPNPNAILPRYIIVY